MVSHDPDDHRRPARPAAATSRSTDLHQTSASRTWTSSCSTPSVDPTERPLVRQALAYATDPTEIVKLFGRGAKPNTSACSRRFHLPGRRQRLPHLRPGQGQAAGGPGRPQPRRHHRDRQLIDITDPRLVNEIQALAAACGSQAGFKITSARSSRSPSSTTWSTGKFQADTDEQFGAADPDLNYVWLSPTTANPPIALNFARNKDDPLEAALQQGRTTSDQAARIEAYQTVDKRLAEDLPYLWVSLATVVDRRGATRCRTSTTRSSPTAPGPRIRRRHLHPDARSGCKA